MTRTRLHEDEIEIDVEMDDPVRQCITDVADEFDPGTLTEAWEISLDAPGSDGPPLWAHSDLLARLRGGGWALAQAVVALPDYRETNPGMTRSARHALSEVLSDVRGA